MREVAWKTICGQNVKIPEAEVPRFSCTAPRDSYFHLDIFKEFFSVPFVIKFFCQLTALDL